MKTRNTKLIALVLALGFLITNCGTVKDANSKQKGVAIGAAAGAILGGVLGNNLGKGGNSELGAVLGAVIGGAAGGVIGNKMDKQAAEIENALPGAEVERVGEGIRVVLGENAINFDFGKSTLTKQAKLNLDKVIPALNTELNTNLLILGYTDSRGSDEFNLNLSKERATAVVNYLKTHNVAPSRIKMEGRGEAAPIATNDTEAGRALNRRVEFVITANEQMIKDAQSGK